MKKGIIVLLIAVLAIGSAFAGKLTGNAKIDFGVDFDAKTWGFKNAQSAKYSFTFEFDKTTVEVGEHKTDVWAEIAAEGSMGFEVKNAPLGSATAAVTADTEVKITKANVHVGEDLTFGILNAGSSKVFAAHYTLDSSKKPIHDTVKAASKKAAGFTVTYKDWNGGFGAEGSWATDPSTFKLFAHVETPAFKLEDLAVEGSAYAYLTDKTTNASEFGGAAKASYKADALSAFVALDANYAAEKFNYEAAAQAKFTFDADANGFGQVDVYATPGALAVPAAYTGDNAKAVKLDAKLSGGYDFALAEKQTLKTTAYVEVTDALLSARELTIGAKETLDVAPIKVILGETYKVYAKTLTLEAEVDYIAELYKAWVKTSAEFKFSSDPAFDKLPLEVGISSDKVVENATLSCVYKNADLIGDDAKKGAVTASLKIAF